MPAWEHWWKQRLPQAAKRSLLPITAILSKCMKTTGKPSAWRTPSTPSNVTTFHAIPRARSHNTAFFQNIKDGALIYAQNFTILAINKAGEEILGISKQEI